MHGRFVLLILLPPSAITTVSALKLITFALVGTPTARLNDFLTKRLITDSPTNVGVSAASTITPTTDVIPFVLDSKSLKHIEDATTEFAKHVGKYQVHYVSYERYGKEGIKKMKTSPDGW